MKAPKLCLFCFHFVLSALLCRIYNIIFTALFIAARVPSRCIDLAADAETGQHTDSRPRAHLALADFWVFSEVFRIFKGIYDSAQLTWIYGPKVTINLDVHRYRHPGRPKLSATTSPVVPQIVGIRGAYRSI